METCADVRTRWRQDPEAFWLAAAELIDWDSSPHIAIDDSQSPIYRWFPDGRLNAWFPEFLSVSRHADGTRTVLAIEYEGAIREIDASGPALRWRSLGTPRVPDGWWLTAAWREGDEVVMLARSGAGSVAPPI